ncbi:MAG: hypothetical protein E7256_12705 [Lachnospiraceae bacterium]|nr:hypothetical protein [Lachnospiraceae bacterium]
MNRLKRKWLSVLLVITMVIGMMPTGIVQADVIANEDSSVWNFRGGEEGAYTGTVEGETGTFNGLTIDATSGSCTAADGNTVVTEGTILNVPAMKGAAVSVVAAKTEAVSGSAVSGAAITANGGWMEKTESDQEVVYSYTLSDAETNVSLLIAGTILLKEISVKAQQVSAASSNMIDVWDFGAVQLDESKYHNMLTEDIINAWYEGVEPGTKSVNIPESVNMGGGLTWTSTTSKSDRLRTMNTNLTRWDDKQPPVIDDASDLNGYLYVNGATPDRYFTIECEKNDTVSIYMWFDNSADVLSFESDAYTATYLTKGAGNGYAEKVTFIAKEAGSYKIHGAKAGKPSYARILRESATNVTVAGTVTVPEGMNTAYELVFTHPVTGTEYRTVVSDGMYEITLPTSSLGVTYAISLAGTNEYIITSNGTVEVNVNGATEDIVIGAVNLKEVTGQIKGLTGEEIAKLSLTFAQPEGKIFVPEVSIDTSAMTYAVRVESGVEYTVIADGVNDYTMDLATFTTEENTTKDITFTAKPTYEVTMNYVGVTKEEVKSLTFTNLKEEGYVYTFSADETVMLRDGVYSVKVASTLVQKLTSNLVVDGAATEKTVKFEAATSWNFSDPDFKAAGGAYTFNGLVLEGVKVNNAKYALGASGCAIQIPVNGEAIINISYCYQADGVIDGVQAFATDTKSTSTIETASYHYTGAAGYVSVTFNGTSYLTEISATPVVAYKETITVGKDGADYATVNDALDAVRSMVRSNAERVTILIQPGNYEEMLVVDIPNVTLKNASKTPSTSLTNKGVDIAENAVRITSYYGHGCYYYSMGNDCKYDAEVLEVNKENGYQSYNNPGAGTTNGSYWNATVVVTADGFEADGIIFENSFNQYVSEKEANDVIVLATDNKGGERSKVVGDTSVQDKSYVERAAALAIANNVDKAAFYNCKIVGRQDTLYGGVNVRAAFDKCTIMGGTDYIFGGMTAVFYKCDLMMNTSENSNDVSYITAAQQSEGRGYLMYNCTITSTTPGVDTASKLYSKPGYFGRPWKGVTSEVVFYKTIIERTNADGYVGDSYIMPIGWNASLSGESDKCYEYGTMEVADVDNSKNRASWSHVLTEPVLADGTKITVDAFLAGNDNWQPITLDAEDDGITDDNLLPVIPGDGEEEVEPDENWTVNFSDVAATNAIETGTSYGYYVVTGPKPKITANAKEIDGFAFTQRFQFNGTGSKTENNLSFKTTGAGKLTVYGLSGSTDVTRYLVLESPSGATETFSVDNNITKHTYTVTEAGTHYLYSKENGFNIYYISFEPEGGSAPVVREDWAKVAAPVLGEVTQDGNKMTIPFTMVLGNDGADKLVITMKDKDGNVAATTTVISEAATSATITGNASGEYTFSAVAFRTDAEDDVKTSNTVSYHFSLVLENPTISSATNTGNGSVSVVWQKVKEAQAYEVAYKADGDAEYTVAKTVTGLNAVIEGLTVGTAYTIRITALRGEERASSEISIKATAEAQRLWSFSAFGQGVDTKNNYFEGSANEGNVTVKSINGKGKLVPASTDGLAFYYTEINPEEENFTLSANVKVNSWTYSNGQEGFGLMAADAVGTNGDSSVFWNNSVMASVTKVEYFWDSSKNAVSDAGDKISMKIGVGAQLKSGATSENIAAGTTVSDGFASTMRTLETSCAGFGAGTYNIVGNFANASAPTGTQETLATEFKLTIRRDNTGYRVSYEDANGNVNTETFYDLDRDILTQIDKDHIYVGFYASRNADITVSDIVLTTINPADDDAAEDRPTTTVTPSYSIISGTATGIASYDLVFRGNADGVLTITDAAGNAVVDGETVSANTSITRNVTLTKGNNTFKVTFTPDKNYKPSEYEVLSSYETAEFTHTVTYRTYGEVGQSLYVTPDGSAEGTGAKNSPLDIYTAVKYVQPGQMIVLAGGTYNLTRTVKIERGIDGTADQMIYMIADQDASERPVFDFGGNCAGMVIAGNYWYFKGFDVTNSQDGQKGIQVSGDNCTLDQLMTYHNGNTGVQVSRYLSTDEYADWPANNLILNCTSYGNADKGYEDADGFAAKLTIGDGNKFLGCIAYNNADDGWDLFAKIESGPIGKVVIENCIAYGNGYLEDGTNAGNGNGFKMGGSSISGHHELINSVAFNNKAKGIDSNSCPDIKVTNCTTFNNESFNIALYTNDAANTDFEADGVISFRTSSLTVNEQFKFKGTQDTAKVYKTTNYFWSNGASTNTKGVAVTEDWFESLDTSIAITRDNDGSINMNQLLTLKDVAPQDAGARLVATPSKEISVYPEAGSGTTGGDDSGNTSGGTSDSSSDNTVTENITVEVSENEDGSKVVSAKPGVTATVVTDGVAEMTVTVSDALAAKLVSSAKDGAEVVLEIPADAVKKQLKDKSVTNVSVTVEIPASLASSSQVSLSKIEIPAAAYDTARSAGKDITVTVKETGEKSYSWTFDKTLLKASKRQIASVNAIVSVSEVNAVTGQLAGILSAVKADQTNVNGGKAQGVVIDFAQEGALLATASVNVYVAGNKSVTGITAGSKVYLYHYDEEAKALAELPTKEYTVDENGYVAIDAACGGTYVLLPNEVKEANTVAILDQVTNSAKLKTIYVDSKAASWKKSKRTFALDLADNMQVVRTFTKNVSDPAMQEVKVTYKSSNRHIAYVSGTGVITANAPGRAVITATVEFSDGTTKTLTSVIWVGK